MEGLEGANALAKQEYGMELRELLERLSILGRVRAPASQAGVQSRSKALATLSAIQRIPINWPRRQVAGLASSRWR